MNNVIEAILKRRSVRDFESSPLSKKDVSAIIDAGNAAPSGCNAQGWRFVVVQDKAFLKKLANLALGRYKKWMDKNASPELKEMRKDRDNSTDDPVYYHAPLVVFVVGSHGMTRDMDTPMVCQNMMLAARSLGIGSCWVFFGQLVLDDPEVRNVLELKEGEKVYGPILFGYPKAGFPESPPKKEPMIKWI